MPIAGEKPAKKPPARGSSLLLVAIERRATIIARPDIIRPSELWSPVAPESCFFCADAMQALAASFRFPSPPPGTSVHF